AARPDTARFADVTSSAGIHFWSHSFHTPRKYFPETMGSGGGFIDYDGDGWPDVLLLSGAPLPGGAPPAPDPQHPAPSLALYHNNRNGSFTDVTHAAGLDRIAMYAMGVAVGDYDNDGRDDFYVSCVLGPGHLLHNEGGSPPRFKDV